MDVTTKLYVPGKLTDGDAVVFPAVIPGPLHEYVPPPDPANVVVVLAHVIVPVDPALAMGFGLIVIVKFLGVPIQPD